MTFPAGPNPSNDPYQTHQQQAPQQLPPGMQQYLQNFATTPDIQLRTLQEQRRQLVRAVLIYSYWLPAMGIGGAVWIGAILLRSGEIFFTAVVALALAGGPLIARATSVKTIKLNIERLDHQIELVKRQIAEGR